MKIDTRWRLVVVVVLVLYCALIVAAVWWLLRNVLLATLLAITAASFAYAGWLIFTGTTKRARKGYALAAFALLLLGLMVVYFVRNADAVRGILAIAVLSVLYLWLLTYLRAYYWRQARRAGQEAQARQFNRPFLIVNPKSGNGRAIRERIPQLAQDMGIRVLVTKWNDDVEEIARRAVAKGADILGVSGGDGSLGAVAKVAIEFNLPLVVLPGGTRCHFARDIGLDPKRIADALQGFRGVERYVDVASINGRIVLNNVSFGLYADIIDHPQYRENKRETIRLVLREFLEGKKGPYHLEFRCKGWKFYKAVQILVGVNRYTTLDVFEMGHRSRMDEGVLHVTAITRLNDSLVTKLLRVMSIGRFKNTRKLPDVYQWLARGFKVTAPSGSIVAGVDGEREEYQPPVKITVLPRALRLYVPAEGVRGRTKNPFSSFVAHELWHVASRGRSRL